MTRIWHDQNIEYLDGVTGDEVPWKVRLNLCRTSVPTLNIQVFFFPSLFNYSPKKQIKP